MTHCATYERDLYPQSRLGIWEVLYNAKNRPAKFTQGTTIITCSYNFMGSRTETKITTNNVITKHERFVNRGYLLIASLDLTRPTQNDLYLILWDPTQPIATRPLAIQKGGTWYTYGHDLTKNITETFTNTGTIAGTYLYSLFGAMSKAGTFEQPIQFSSEPYDSELGLTYYHFRHYTPKDGRWISRDLIGERGGWNEYAFIGNSFGADALGLFLFGCQPLPKEKPRADNQLEDLEKRMIELCTCTCCKEDEDKIKECKEDATKISKAIVTLWNTIKSDPKKHGPSGHIGNRHGYMCWDWAEAFVEIAKSQTSNASWTSKWERVNGKGCHFAPHSPIPLK